MPEITLSPTKLMTMIALCVLLLVSGCVQGEGAFDNPDGNIAATKPVIVATPTPIPTKTIPPSPDMSGETFTLYVVSSSDEPFTVVTSVVRQGLKDYADYRNAHGGVNGAEIAFQFADVDATGAGAVNAYELFAERENALAIIMLSPVNQELYDLINQEDIPVIYFGVGAYPLDRLNRGDRLFWLVPPPAQQLAFWLDYSIENWDELGPEGQQDVMRLNYLSWMTPLEDLDRLAGIRAYFEEKNIILSEEGQINPSPNGSASNPILDGVFVQSTLIYADLFAYGPAMVMNDLSYLDLGDFFVTAGGSWAVGNNLEDYITAPNSSIPFYTSHPLAGWSETSNPGIIFAEDVLDYVGRESSGKELAYLYALAAMDLVVKGIEVSLEEYKDTAVVEIEPKEVYQALSELEEYAVLGGLMTLDFASGDRTPTEMRVWKYIPGVGMVLESDYLPVIENE
jgi:ABC-type branched-subunit amino acid transport system substrate-binding protein